MYHASIAIGHFARRLRADSPGARNEYQVVAVLQALWLRAPDMLADSPRVVVSFDDLAGIVDARPRFRQIIARLKAIGALTRAEVGYVLFKPTVEHLDEQARVQAETAWQLGGGTAKQPKKTEPLPLPKADDVAKLQRERSEDKQDAQARRRETLTRLGKQPSDIRDVLAWLAGKQADSLRYSGKGSGATQVAIEWFADSAASWQDFERVCKIAKQDKSPDKPAEIEWLFASRNAAYLGRLLAGSGIKRVKDYTPEKVAGVLAKNGAVKAEALALARTHWLDVEELPISEFQSRVLAWKQSPANDRMPLATIFAPIGNP